MKIAERMTRSWNAAAIVWAVGALAIGMVGVVRPAAAANAIETTYKTAGTFSVSTATVTDASGLVYNLYYPTTLGTGGMRHPIITWGNGSNATPGNYYGLLNHLASWGFVVVAVDDPTTGTGAEMLAAAQYMVARDSDGSSIFYQKLDTGKVGAIGHSQGAGGTVNVTNHSKRGDSIARGAFAGTTPEIDTNTSWSNQAQKNLP